MTITTRPLTPDLWPDFERLMGPRGGADGCWCSLWRQSAKAYREGKGAANKALMEAVVRKGPPPGLLAWLDDAPAGWISIAPRRDFPRLKGSKVMAPVDDMDEGLWSVSCFFIRPEARGSGVASELLRAACDFAAEHGARMVEGYPIDPLGERYASGSAWTGLSSRIESSSCAGSGRRERC